MVSELTNLVGAMLAQKREEAIKKALDLKYPGGEWDEEDIKEKASIVVLPSGDELFKLGAEDLILFGQVTMKVKIDFDPKKVECTFDQQIIQMGDMYNYALEKS